MHAVTDELEHILNTKALSYCLRPTQEAKTTRCWRAMTRCPVFSMYFLKSDGMQRTTALGVVVVITSTQPISQCKWTPQAAICSIQQIYSYIVSLTGQGIVGGQFTLRKWCKEKAWNSCSLTATAPDHLVLLTWFLKKYRARSSDIASIVKGQPILGTIPAIRRHSHAHHPASATSSSSCSGGFAVCLLCPSSSQEPPKEDNWRGSNSRRHHLLILLQENLGVILRRHTIIHSCLCPGCCCSQWCRCRGDPVMNHEFLPYLSSELSDIWHYHSCHFSSWTELWTQACWGGATKQEEMRSTFSKWYVNYIQQATGAEILHKLPWKWIVLKSMCH